MAALYRAILLLRSDHGLDGEHHLVPRQSHTVETLDSSTKAGFIAMGICGLISFIATLSLLSFLTYRFIFWKRYYKRPLAHNQYVVLIYQLLLVDLQQATAFLLCLHWVTKGAVYYPSAACVLQGWWIQTADPGSGLFVIAIAMHTGAVVLRGRQLSFRAFVACVIGLWAFILVLGFIAVGLYGPKTFVISEAAWCWLSPEHENERLWGHYLWIFLAEFGTVVLYGMMFFYLRRRMMHAAKLRPNHQDSLKRLNRVVIYMVIYPFAYVLLSLPLAAGRMSSARHVIPSRQYFAAAGSLMALSGLADAAVYTLTRRQLLLDTDLSQSDGPYNRYAYSGSHTYHTQVTSTTGGRDKKRGRFRKGMQTLNETIQDDRDDSTEEIVKGGRNDSGDVEMVTYTGHGVYQETTIEITHEVADPQEFPQRERHSG